MGPVSKTREKRDRGRSFLLGGAGLLLLAVTVGVSTMLGGGDAPALEGPISLRVNGTSTAPDSLGALGDEDETGEEVTARGRGEREVLGVVEVHITSFEGKVEDRVSLEGVVGASVKVVVGEDTYSGETGAGGAFSMEVPEDAALNVEVSAAEYNPVRRAGVDSDEDAVFRLNRTSSLKGKVLGPGGEDLLRTEIHVTSDDRREERLLELTPDERGEFELVGLEPGEFNVAAWSPGWSFDVKRDIIVRPGDVTYVVLELVRAGSASAQVVYEGTTSGVPGIEVQIEPWVQGLPREVEDIVLLEFVTDEVGNVQLDSLNPGENRVRLYAEWGEIKYAPRLLVESGEHQHLTWTIPRSAECGGVLLDASGQPTAGSVAVTPTPNWGRGQRSALEDGWERRKEWPLQQDVGPDGRFLFEAVPTTTSLRFHGTSSEDPSQLGILDQKFQAGGAATDLELRMTQMLTISGQVVDPDDQPVPDASVTTWGMRRAPTADSDYNARTGRSSNWAASINVPVITDEEGRFELEGLLAGRNGVVVRHDRFKTQYQNIRESELREPLVIRMEVPDGLKGRVVDGNGDAVPWARVSGTRGNDRRRNESTNADEFGRFSFESLREGTWKFYAYLSGYERVETLQVEVPFEGEITLRMRRVRTPDPAIIRGLAMLPDGQVPTRLRMQRLNSAAMAVDGGEFRINGLSPGEHNLVLEASGCAQRSLGEIVLREGEERDVGVVRMFPGTSVEVSVNAEGEVPGESGRSISDARVRLHPVSGFAVEAGRGTRRPYRARRGTYPMGTLEHGTWRVEVRRDGFKRWESELVLGADDNRKVRVILEPRE
jgi:protocatechuate 3,4-dioxygenase beta subunit